MRSVGVAGASSTADFSGSLDETLTIREPRQARTREQWARILDRGLELLQDEGYDGFTIAALCERADVPPRALYARADGKDALFLAVYEHGMRRVVASESAFADPDLWHGLAYAERIDLAVESLLAVFRENEAFLRAIVLISSAHPEVLRRGQVYQRAVQARFIADLRGAEDAPADAEAREAFCFGVVFSTLVVRTAYAGLAIGLAADADLEQLKALARGYLLGGAERGRRAARRPADPHRGISAGDSSHRRRGS